MASDLRTDSRWVEWNGMCCRGFCFKDSVGFKKLKKSFEAARQLFWSLEDTRTILVRRYQKLNKFLIADETRLFVSLKFWQVITRYEVYESITDVLWSLKIRSIAVISVEKKKDDFMLEIWKDEYFCLANFISPEKFIVSLKI